MWIVSTSITSILRPSIFMDNGKGNHHDLDVVMKKMVTRAKKRYFLLINLVREVGTGVNSKEKQRGH